MIENSIAEMLDFSRGGRQAYSYRISDGILTILLRRSRTGRDNVSCYLLPCVLGGTESSSCGNG